MKENNRQAWADIAKGLAIFFIVWGHAASGAEEYFFRNELYSFHVPAFLIIAGVFTKELKKEDLTARNFGTYLRKQVFRILIPYLFWGIFFSDFSLANILPIFYGSYQSIKSVNPVGALWFVPAFFLARILIWLILALAANVRVKQFVTIPAAVVCYVGGFLLPLLKNGYPFSFNIALVFVGFMLMGYSVKTQIKQFAEAKFVWRIAAFGVSFLLFSVGTFFRADSLELVCFYKGVYGSLFWFFWNGISGSSALIFLGMVLAQWADAKPVRVLRFLGTESLGIMLVHVPFIRQLTLPLFDAIGFTSPFWLEAFCAAVLATALSVGLVVLFEYLAPVFVGKRDHCERREIQ